MSEKKKGFKIMNEMEKSLFKTKEKQKLKVVEKTTSQHKNSDVEKEFEKKLRRPRSKKKMRLLSKIDLPSLSDEEILERMAEEKGAGSDMGSQNSLFGQSDIEKYLDDFKNEFNAMVEKEIQEEKEREEEQKRRQKEREEEMRRREEERKEQRRREEEIRANMLQFVLAKCTIPGCVVHTIKRGAAWNDVIHYSDESIPQEAHQAYKLLKKNWRCSCVEVYPNRYVAIASGGEVIEILKKEDVK